MSIPFCLSELTVIICVFSLHMIFIQYDWLEKREFSIGLVLQDPKYYSVYDGFEIRLDKYINSIYFETLCSNDDGPSRTWLMNFVEEHCPASMSQAHCALTEMEKATCDTTSCNKSNLSECCPSRTLCTEGKQNSCPYYHCRIGILEELFVWTGYVIGNSDTFETFTLVYDLLLSLPNAVQQKLLRNLSASCPQLCLF